MNKVVLLGRLVRDPEVRYSQGDKPTAVAQWTLAVDRKFKREGEPDADFISCKAFGKTAEFVEKYFKQGSKIALEGHIQTGSYTNKEGVKVYTTDVMVEQVEFAESKGSGSGDGGSSRPAPSQAQGEGFMNIPEDLGEELPFS